MIDSESAQEAAKAVQEVAKATQSAIDASREAGGFLAKYLDDPLTQMSALLEGRLKYARSIRLPHLQHPIGDPRQKKRKSGHHLHLTLHLRMWPAGIVIQPRRLELALPRFLREEPLGLSALLRRKEHRMAGTFFLVDPPDRISDTNLNLGRGKAVVLNGHFDRLLCKHRWQGEPSRKKDECRPIRHPPFSIHDRKPHVLTPWGIYYCLTAFTSPSAPTPSV